MNLNNTIKLTKAANITTGRLDSNASEKNGIYPFFTCAPEPQRINSYEFDCNAILLAGNNAAGNFHISKYYGKFNAYQRTYIITNKENYDLDYLYYSLKISLATFKRISQGSQTKFLTMDILDSFKVLDIGIPKQKKIVCILKMLDSKILLNNKINAELEQMARNLFNYWFVQFDFPNKEDKPYKTSGGEMEYSALLKRDIPVNWKVGKLGEFISIKRGISYKSKEIGDEGLPMINLNSFNLDGAYKWDGLKYYSGKVNNEKIINAGDLLIATTDVTRRAKIIGKAFIIPDIFNESIVMSCDIAKVEIDKNLDKFYLELLFNSDYFHKYIKGFASGTMVLHLDVAGIEMYKCVIPPEWLLKKYASVKEDIERKKSLILKENEELSKVRDFLLPLFMNGQVKIS